MYIALGPAPFLTYEHVSRRTTLHPLAKCMDIVFRSNIQISYLNVGKFNGAFAQINFGQELIVMNILMLLLAFVNFEK